MEKETFKRTHESIAQFIENSAGENFDINSLIIVAGINIQQTEKGEEEFIVKVEIPGGTHLSIYVPLECQDILSMSDLILIGLRGKKRRDRKYRFCVWSSKREPDDLLIQSLSSKQNKVENWVSDAILALLRVANTNPTQPLHLGPL